MKTLPHSKTPPKRTAKPKKNDALLSARSFSVRDLNRDTATVLKSARENGRTTIRSRSGEVFGLVLLKPATAVEKTPTDFNARLTALHERMRALGYKPPTKEGWKRIADAISSDR